MRNPGKLKDFVYDEADEYSSFELDDVRVVTNDDNGVTLRVLSEDGDEEADQVGFQVTRPRMDQGRQMFNERVLNGLRELRNRYRDDRGETSREFDPSSPNEAELDDRQETDHEDTEAPSSRETTGTVDRPSNDPLGPLAVTLSVDEDAEQALVEEFESIVEEIDDVSASQDALDEVEERLDAIDDRLTQLEEALSMVGQ